MDRISKEEFNTTRKVSSIINRYGFILFGEYYSDFTISNNNDTIELWHNDLNKPDDLNAVFYYRCKIITFDAFNEWIEKNGQNN